MISYSSDRKLVAGCEFLSNLLESMTGLQAELSATMDPIEGFRIANVAGLSRNNPFHLGALACCEEIVFSHRDGYEDDLDEAVRHLQALWESVPVDTTPPSTETESATGKKLAAASHSVS